MTMFEVASRELPWGEKMSEVQMMYAVCLRNERPSLSRLQVSLVVLTFVFKDSTLIFIQ